MPVCIRVAPFAEPAAVTRLTLEHQYLANVTPIIEEAHTDDAVVAAVAEACYDLGDALQVEVEVVDASQHRPTRPSPTLPLMT